MYYETWFKMNDQDLEFINTQTRLEKFRNFFNNHIKKIIFIITFLIILLIIFFSFTKIKDKKIEISENYKYLTLNINTINKTEVMDGLREIILKRDTTYSPLALYYMIDNNLISSVEEVNEYFDILINETDLKEEIRLLNIYKKGLYNSNFSNEDKLLEILKPLLNKDNEWKSHSQYLLAEFYYFKKNMAKAKEFYEKILLDKNLIDPIKLEVQKRLQRDFSD